MSWRRCANGRPRVKSSYPGALDRSSVITSQKIFVHILSFQMTKRHFAHFAGPVQHPSLWVSVIRWPSIWQCPSGSSWCGPWYPMQLASVILQSPKGGGHRLVTPVHCPMRSHSCTVRSRARSGTPAITHTLQIRMYDSLLVQERQSRCNSLRLSHRII